MLRGDLPKITLSNVTQVLNSMHIVLSPSFDNFQSGFNSRGDFEPWNRAVVTEKEGQWDNNSVQHFFKSLQALADNVWSFSFLCLAPPYNFHRISTVTQGEYNQDFGAFCITCASLGGHFELKYIYPKWQVDFNFRPYWTDD